MESGICVPIEISTEVFRMAFIVSIIGRTFLLNPSSTLLSVTPPAPQHEH